MVAKELQDKQTNQPTLTVVSSERPVIAFNDVCALLSQEAAKAQEMISPELHLIVLAGHNESPSVQEIQEKVHAKRENGGALRGSVQLFVRRRNGSRYHGGPVGVPVRTVSEQGEIEVGSYIGFYVPHAQDRQFGSAYNIQMMLDHDLDEFYAHAKNTKTRLNFEDHLLVVTREQVQFWSEFGMWEDLGPRWEHESGIETQNVADIATQAEGADFAAEVELTYSEVARQYMESEYLPALMTALALLGDHKMVPNQLLPGGKPSDILTFINGRFLMVNVGVLISTAHNERLKAAIYRRDGNRCQFPYGQGPLLADQRFSVGDLIKLEEEISQFRVSDDPNHNLVGTDLSGVRTDDESSRFRCGLNMLGYYTDIHPMKKRLELGGTYANLHHIIPRGAAYRALLTALLMDEQMPGGGVGLKEWSVRDMALLLRGASLRYLISDQSMHLYEDQRHVIDVLTDNAFFLDSVVNSPYNLIMLCSHHHNDFVHPDMDFGRQFLALFHAINTRRVQLSTANQAEFERVSGEYIQMMLAGKLPPVPEEGYADVMRAIKQARYLVSAMGVPYWYIPTADYLLDWARVSTDVINRQEREGVIRSYLTGSSHLDQLGRDRAWQAAQMVENLQDNVAIPRITRSPGRLSSFKDWENAGTPDPDLIGK